MDTYLCKTSTRKNKYDLTTPIKKYELLVKTFRDYKLLTKYLITIDYYRKMDEIKKKIYVKVKMFKKNE